MTFKIFDQVMSKNVVFGPYFGLFVVAESGYK